MKPKPSVTIIGTGALGSALLQFFKNSDYKIKSYWNSGGGSIVERPEFFTDAEKSFPTDKNEIGEWIFITTPDDVIKSISDKFLNLSSDWTGTSFIHCSGGKTSDILHPLKKAGAKTASMHPIQTFRKGDDESRFKNISISIEGDEILSDQLKTLAEEMGGKPLKLSSEEKKSVHIAAVFASNYIVAILGAAEKYLADEGIENGLKILNPLFSQTLQNISEMGAEGALSGPVARGDEDTIKNHLSMLKGADSEKVYKILGREAVRIALSGKQINEEKADRLKKLFA